MKDIIKYLTDKTNILERLQQLKEEEQEIIDKFPAFGIIKSDDDYLKEIESEMAKKVEKMVAEKLEKQLGETFG